MNVPEVHSTFTNLSYAGVARNAANKQSLNHELKDFVGQIVKHHLNDMLSKINPNLLNSNFND